MRQPLPNGEIGQFAVGGCVTPGYFNAPELNAEAFDRDGYFLTGDLGSIAPDGRIRFRGRLKEMIKGTVNLFGLPVTRRGDLARPATEPGSTFVRVPRAGHMVTLEQPEAATRAISGFLDGLADYIASAPRHRDNIAAP
jgi:hypothetical protein